MKYSSTNEKGHKLKVLDWMNHRKVFMVLFLCCIIQTISTKAFSQTTELSLNLKNVSVEQVLNQIEAKTTYRFLYNKNMVDVNHKVSIVCKKQNVSQTLDQIFKGLDIAYTINGKQIVLSKIEKRPVSNTTKKVNGTITDEKGEPIIGATVLVEGESAGTITDVNGKFALTVPSDSKIKISYIGFESKLVSVYNQNILNISLSESSKVLDELVVIGFGTQKKVNLTGSVASVNTKQLESRPVTNLSNALQGITPGLNITQSSGSLEGRPTVNIRGITTIGQGSSGSPLILIDGMEGDLNTVNPQDIDNISVLKDAAASSIYGSRAPFGVILITTRQGEAGKMKINYNGNCRMNEPLSLPKMMDSYTFVNYFNAAQRNVGKGDFFDAERVQRVKDFIDGKLGKNTDIVDPNNASYWGDGYSYGNDNIDWYRAIYKTSTPSQQHSLSTSGGTEKVNYYLSADYLNQEGLMKLNQDTYNSYSINAKVNAKLSKWASLAYTARFTREDYVKPTALSDNLYQHLGRQGWPTLPLYDPNGYLFSSPSPALALRDGGQTKTQTDWNYQQLNLTLEPLAGWKIFANLNYKIGDIFYHSEVLPTYQHDVNGDPFLSVQGYYLSSNSGVTERASRTNYFSPNIYTEYTKSMGKNNIKAMVGFQSEINKYRVFDANRVGVMVTSSTNLDLTSGTDYSGTTVAPSVNGSYTDWATQGVFGRLNYDYDGRYLVEADLRYDGTSRFRAANRWKYFPSASFGWNVSREKFWETIEPFVNTLKLRASYGDLGNQNTTSLYPTYVTMPVGISNGTWIINGARPNSSSSPALLSSTMTWERIKTYNVGVDLGLLDNRLTSSFDYYIRYTNDMIGPAPELPVTLGTTVPTTNNTDLKTKGFEFSLTWNDRLDNGLGYNVNFVLSDSKTEITRYPNPTGNLSTYYTGQQYGEIWGYTTIGIAKTQEEMDKHLATLENGGQNAVGSNWGAGDIMYKDVNKDGKIDNGSNTVGDHGDYTVIGNNQPRFNFGLNLSANWKNVDCSLFLQGVAKRDYWQGSSYFFGASGAGVWHAVALVQHKDYFRGDASDYLGLNLDSYYPRPLQGDERNIKPQTRYLQNAAYIRLKNLQLGYTIPANITQKVLIQKCRIYVSGENLLTCTKLSSLFDPETIDGGYSSNGNAYPLNKVYSVGASLTF